MKNLKKVTSGILAMLMIFTSLSLTCVVSAAETSTIILEEDCSDAPVDKKADDPTTDSYDQTATFGEWQIIGKMNPDYDVANPPVKSADSTGMTLQHSRVDETNAQMYAVRKITQDTSAQNLKSGIYEISFDVTPSTDSWLTVSIIDTNDKDLLSAWDTKHKRNMILNLVNKNSTFKANNASTGWKTQYTEDTVPNGVGYIYQSQATTGVWSNSDYWKMGVIDETKAVAVKAVVDMDQGCMATYIYQNNKLVTANAKVTLAPELKTNGLGYIVFGNAHGDTKISNLKVKKLEGYDGRFYGIAEGFDNTQLILENTLQVPASHRGWSKFATLATSETVTTPTTTSIISEKAGQTNVLKTDDPNQMNGSRLLLNSVTGNALKSSYKINYKMFVESGEVFAELSHDIYSSKRIQVRLDAADGKVRNFASDIQTGNLLYQNQGSESGTFDPTKWCDVEVIVNVAEGKWSYTVSQNGTAVATASDLDMSDDLKNNGINFIEFRAVSSTNTPVYYIDDISVEEYEYVYVEPVFENVDENFDSWTEVPQNLGWAKVADNYNLPTVKTVDGTNKALFVGPENGVDKYETGIRYTFSKNVTEGTLNVSYDLKVKKGADKNGDNGHILWPTLDPATDGSVFGFSIPTINNYNSKLNDNLVTDVGETATVLGALAADTWYTVSISARPGESKYDFKIVNKADESVFCDRKNVTMEDQKGNVQTIIKCLSFRTWVGENWIDNLKIEYVKQVPTLSNSSIEMYDAFGTKTSSITSNVTPALGKIVLDFGTAMKTIDGITLTGTNAPEISAAIDETDKNIVTITTTGLLKAGETYILTIPGTVTALNGEVMGGSGFELEFTAGTVETSANMTGLVVGEDKIENFAGISAKNGSMATIKTSAVNVSADPMKLTYIIAYYDGKKCIKATTVPVSDITTNSILSTQPEFEINVPTNADKVKIFLWSTINKMIPYCDALTFE